MKKKISTDKELDTPIDWDWAAKQKPLTRQEAKALGIPTPEEAAKMPRVRLRGGARPGAGRKPKDNVQVLIRISKVTRKHIQALAKKEKKTISAIIESRFAVR
jgi:hypothetical protein